MARRPTERAAALAIAAAGGALAALAVRPLMPPFVPVGDYAGYGATTARATVLVEPVVHAPWFGAASMPVAAVTAGVVVLCLWLASRRLGAGRAATVVAAAAWMARPDIAAPWSLGADAIVAVALVWASLLMMAGVAAPAPAAARPRAGLARMAAAVLCAAAAVGLWPPLVVVSPVVVAAGVRAGPALGLLLAAATAGGVAAGLQRWAWRASALAGEPVAWLDVWQVATSLAPRGSDPFPWPPLTAAVLPVALALVGAVLVMAGAARRGWWVSGALVTLAVVLAPSQWRPEAVRALYWSAWPLVAVGLTWLVHRAAPRARPLAFVAVSAVLIGGGWAARVRHVESEEGWAFAAQLAAAIAGNAGRGVVLVAEDTRLDTAMVAWDGGARLSRVRPVPALVEAARGRGPEVLAGPSSRTALELWGFRFRPGPMVTAPVRYELAGVQGRFQCTTVSARWNELAGLDYSGRLGVHLPRGSARLEVVVAGAPPLVVRAATPDGRPAGRLTSGPATSLSSLPPVLWPGDGRLPDAAATMTRFELTAHPDYDQDASLFLGARAPLVGARVVGDGAGATVCAAPLPRHDPFAVAPADAVVVAVDDDAFFAGGWHGAEGAGAGAFRWTTARAVTLVPAASSQAVTIAVDARPAASPNDGAVTLRLTVNGGPLGERVLTAATQSYEWTVPAALWVDGTNELVLDVSRVVRPADAGASDTRQLGVAVSAIRLRR